MNNELLIQQTAQKFIDESTPEVVESQSEVTTEQVEQPSEVAKPVEQPRPKEIDPRTSFRELREKAKRLERENMEAMRIAEQYKQQLEQQQQSKPTRRFNDDDIIEGKHLNEFEEKYLKQQQELEQLKIQNHQMQLRNRLYAKYTDFDKVVNEENLALLSEMEPEIAATLNSSNDPYSAALAAYKYIKQSGIAGNETISTAYDEDKKRAQANAAKPRPLSSVSPQQGESPLSRANAFANGLTEDLKSQLLKEMAQARKNH